MEDEKIEYILPTSNISPPIPKKDIWMIWLVDGEDHTTITEFQIYDLDYQKPLPYDQSKASRTFSYIRHRLDRNKVCFRDWGANCSGWKDVQLADVLFKFGIQDGFKNREVVEQFLNQLSLVKEWRKDIIMYMGFMGMRPYYNFDDPTN